MPFESAFFVEIRCFSAHFSRRPEQSRWWQCRNSANLVKVSFDQSLRQRRKAAEVPAQWRLLAPAYNLREMRIRDSE